MKYREALQSVDHSIDRKDSELLLGKILGKKRHYLYTENKELKSFELKQFLTSVQVRKEGVPVQYILKEAPFLDLLLYIDERTLIPRPETEQLVERTIQKLAAPELIIDVGTGSGAIAIVLSRAFGNTMVLATEISRNALSVARKNIERYGLKDRINLIAADLFDFKHIILQPGCFDLVISNPPYVRTEDIENRYEPRIALDGGEDGLKIMRPLIEGSAEFLKSGGLLAMEIDPLVGEEVKGLIKNESWEEPFLEYDYNGFLRFLFVRRV